MSKKIIFVDDEVRVLDGLQRMLRPFKDEWEPEFASGGEEALKKMSERNFDIIVSDIRMPGMDGGALLSRVKEMHPDTIRFALSGQSDQETWVKVANLAHQFLSKPCSAEKLKSCIGKAVQLRSRLKNKRLLDHLSQMDSLPSPPRLYFEMMDLMQKQNVSLTDIAKLVERDVAMSAKVLQLINSAATGLPTHISSPSQAVSLLGMGTIRALVLFIHVVNHLRVSNPAIALFQEMFHIHSMRVSQAAHRIAMMESTDKNMIQEASIAGMLHDIGHLIYATRFSKDFAKLLKEHPFGSQALLDSEVAEFGASHPDIGGCLLAMWGLSDPIVEAVTFHHAPVEADASGLTTLTTVHVANALAEPVDIPKSAAPMARTLNMPYIDSLGLTPKLEIWRQAVSAHKNDKL